MTMEECVAAGGHHWETGARGILGDFAETEELCTTCPAQRFRRVHCFSPDVVPMVVTEPQSREGDLCTRVRQVIATSGRSQAAFARATGIGSTKLSKALAGTRRFTPFELALIAEEGRTSTDWLMGWTTLRDQ